MAMPCDQLFNVITMAPDEQTNSFSREISLDIDVSIEWRQFQDGESESLTARENCKKYVYFYTGWHFLGSLYYRDRRLYYRSMSPSSLISYIPLITIRTVPNPRRSDRRLENAVVFTTGYLKNVLTLHKSGFWGVVANLLATNMLMSWHRNALLITDHLWGESTRHTSIFLLTSGLSSDQEISHNHFS